MSRDWDAEQLELEKERDAALAEHQRLRDLQLAGHAAAQQGRPEASPSNLRMPSAGITMHAPS
jgi:hypothetical protein